MNSKELKNIWEAYTQVYEEIGVPIPAGKTAKDVLEPLTKKHGGGKVVEPKKTTLQQAHYDPEGELVEEQETDEIFNDILEYLVSEGYADTNDAAIAIIANMSEGWGHNLIEATLSAKAARAGKDIGKPGKMFSKIAKEAGERYGSEERGKKVAGAILAKMRAKASR